jgi:hypothetical protein
MPNTLNFSESIKAEGLFGFTCRQMAIKRAPYPTQQWWQWNGEPLPMAASKTRPVAPRSVPVPKELKPLLITTARIDKSQAPEAEEGI